MATDNTTLLNGAVIRDKVRGTVKTQVVGLDINIGGNTEYLLKAGQQVMANSLPVTLASDQPAIETNLKTNLVVYTPTITVSTSAYTANNCVGGKFVLSSLFRATGTAVKLDSVFIADAADQKAPFDLLFFNEDPTTATLLNAQAAVIGTAVNKLVAWVNVPTLSYKTISSKAMFSISNLGILIPASTATSLYFAIVTSGTPTYANAADLTVRLGFSRDV